MRVVTHSDSVELGSTISGVRRGTNEIFRSSWMLLNVYWLLRYRHRPIGPIFKGPEMSNYQSVLRNVPEERVSHYINILKSKKFLKFQRYRGGGRVVHRRQRSRNRIFLVRNLHNAIFSQHAAVTPSKPSPCTRVHSTLTFGLS